MIETATGLIFRTRSLTETSLIVLWLTILLNALAAPRNPLVTYIAYHAKRATARMAMTIIEEKA